MISDADKVKIIETASILRLQSRNYYDTYKHMEDSENAYNHSIAMKAHEKYTYLNKLANELDIIAEGEL